MTWLRCLFTGHRWFQTVVTHAQVMDWDDDYSYDLCEFEERICLRCQKNQAVFQKTLGSHSIAYEGVQGGGRPLWFDQPAQHFPLPGDWCG